MNRNELTRKLVGLTFHSADPSQQYGLLFDNIRFSDWGGERRNYFPSIETTIPRDCEINVILMVT